MSTRRSIWILIGALLLPAALAPPAHAGEYTVRSCFSDGIDAVWSRYRSDGFADAYVQCPQGVNGNGGLIARNVKTGASAPGLSHAKLYVNTPPGTYIDEIHFDGFLIQSRGWVPGLYDRQNSRWVWCGTGCGSSFIWGEYHIGLATNSLEALVICGASTCSSDGEITGSIQMRNVTLRLQDVWGPSVSIVGGSLASGGWKRGVQTVDVAGSDNTGVRVLRALVDGVPLDEQFLMCDEHLLVQCASNGQRTLVLDLRDTADGAHTLEAQAVDSGGNRTSAHRTVLVDNSAPGPVLGLTTTAGDWQPINSFGLNWSNPAEGGAPIAAAAYQLCSAASPSTSLCGPIKQARKLALESLSGVTVPSPGAWRLRLWLVDEAGNQNEQTAREVALRWDPEPPAVKLLKRDENDPARINVAASDAVSGLASAEIELRREGDSAWHSLRVEPTADGFTGVIDDEKFPHGTYALRARARDRAGNEKSTEATPASITLPVRLATNLAVGRSKIVRADSKKHRHRVLIAKPRSHYGETIRLSGRLTSPGGNPLVDRDVEISERLKLPDTAWRPVATVRTGKSGRFRFKALPGPNRLLRFRYAGTPKIRGKTSIVEMRVRAASSLRVSRRRVVNGDEVVFRGRVKSRPIPPTGKLLQLQVYARGSWLTFATPHTNARGRWRHRYRFTATRGVTHYRFRVRLPRESGYPYDPGSSRTLHVTVTGL
jgi:hypothetical protein